MKLKAILFLTPMLVSVSELANGATILASNFANADTSVVIDTNNVQVAGGYAALGYFSITDSAIATSSGSQLAAAFQILGSSGGTSYDAGGGYFLNGTFDLSASAATLTGSSFITKNIYLVVGNGASLGASSQAFIFKSTSTFLADPSSPSSLDFTAGPPAGTPILGLTGITFTPQYSGAGVIAGNQVSTAYKMAPLAVPEPSALILGAVGVLGLLRRRRA